MYFLMRVTGRYGQLMITSLGPSGRYNVVRPKPDQRELAISCSFSSTSPPHLPSHPLKLAHQDGNYGLPQATTISFSLILLSQLDMPGLPGQEAS